MIDPESVTHDTALGVFHLAFLRRVGVGLKKMLSGWLFPEEYFSYAMRAMVFTFPPAGLDFFNMR